VVVSILSTEIKRETIYADALFLVVLYGQEMLLHIEFQSTVDKTMAECLLEYNVHLSKEHGNLPVYSCVVYLRKADGVPQSPLIRRLPNGKEVVQARCADLGAGITEKVNRIEDPLILQDIMFKLAAARDSEEVRKPLLEMQ